MSTSIPTGTPGTTYDDWACCVHPPGDVDYNNFSVYGSYGKSPRMSSTDSACNVLSTGHVDYDYHNVVPYNSYGRIISPDMGGASGACYVRSSGDVDYSLVVNNSYGNLLLHAHIILVK